jgi:predicted DsbA family dithiol-disulfide isomerase
MSSEQRRVYPTIRSHRLVEFARRKGGIKLQGAVVEDLFHRYFELGADISDVTLLSEVARDNGLDQVRKSNSM